MKPSFRITQRAYDDLKNIARYTRQQWGEAQRDRYLGALDSQRRSNQDIRAQAPLPGGVQRPS